MKTVNYKINSQFLTKAVLVFIISLCSIKSFSQWTTSALNQSRSSLGAAVSRNKAFFAGGGYYSANMALGSVEVYDNSTGTWSLLSLSQARFNLSGAGSDSKVLFAGGVTNFSSWPVTTRVDIYDLNTMLWTTASLSQARGICASTSNGVIVLFAGGVKNFSSYTMSNAVDIYNSSTDTWSISQLSLGRGAFTAVTLNNKAYFAGGIVSATNTTAEVTDRIDIYDYETGTWTQDSLSVARGGLSSAAAGNKIVFAGGHDSFYNASGIADIYDVSSNTWTTHSLSQPRGELTAVALGNKIYVCGGTSSYNIGTLSNVVDIYDTQNDTWTVSVLSAGRAELSSVSIGNKILIAGGGWYGSSATFNNVDIYTDASSGIEPVNSIIPNKFELGQNYPNPFNPSTKISFAVSEKSFIRLEIYDMLGREVSKLVNGFLDPGNYRVDFSGNDKSGGIYYYKISDNKTSITKTMLLLK